MLFLTENPRRGPISIHMPAHWQENIPLRIHDPVQMAGGGIEFSRSGRIVQTDHLSGWSPPAAVLDRRTDQAGQRKRLVTLATSLLRSRPGRGLSSILSYQLGVSTADQAAVLSGNIIGQAARLRSYLAERNAALAVEASSRFLGYGPGLTPSGDDFLVGMVLLLNRWAALDWGNEKLAMLNQELVRAAYQKTTTLSARLIECAAGGGADEFLIAAADYLVAAAGDEKGCLEGLLSWGSSSGIDTLAGMALVILA